MLHSAKDQVAYLLERGPTKTCRSTRTSWTASGVIGLLLKAARAQGSQFTMTAGDAIELLLKAAGEQGSRDKEHKDKGYKDHKDH